MGTNMPDFERLLYERRGKIVYITLNRPEILNAYDDQMGEELIEAWFQFDSDPEAHVAIISGSGRAFCSGADVRQRQLRPVEELRAFGGPAGRKARYDGRSVNYKPTIAAIHGYAYGIGWGTANLCDFIVAAEGTQMQITETRRGLGSAPGFAGAWFFSASRFANDIAITGRSFTAEEALEHGLINKIVPTDQLMDAAEAYAAEILKNPPLAVRATVQASRWMRSELGRSALLFQEGQRLYLTDDFREGARAFMEKREPDFKGQ